MDRNNMIEILKKEYDLNIESIEKIKSTYKVKTDNGGYCLKIISYQYPHFYFIISAMEHLLNKKEVSIPNIIRTNDDKNYIRLKNNYAYLTKWIEARESNYNNPLELKKVIEEVAKFHKSSEGFTIDKDMKPRIGWFKWISTYETRGKEILNFKERIKQKACKSEFDKIYMEIMDKELLEVERSITELKNSQYTKIMEREVLRRGFCHHDLANHNVLIDKNEKVNFIDFDYCIVDTHLHDLASLLIRNMKNSKWDIDRAKEIIDCYSNVYEVTSDELLLIKNFIRFPQDYWQVGIQYYWEMQPWGEEFFINKLMRYVNDKDEKERLLDSFLEIL